MHREDIEVHIEIDNKKSNTFRASYTDVGSGPIILFLHGLLCDSDVWCRFIHKLSRDYRCVCLDLLGCGNSSKPDIAYSINTQAKFVQAFVESISISHFYLVGHSMGSWISILYENLYPGRVYGLVLLAPAGLSKDLLKPSILRLFTVQRPFFEWLILAIGPILKLLDQDYLLQSLKFTRYSIFNDSIMKDWATQPYMIPANELIDNVVNHIYINSLVIAAEFDELIPLQQCIDCVSKMPNAKLEVIRDVDHDLPRNSPKQVEKLIREFIQENDSEQVSVT